MTLLGYAQVSTLHQSPDMQVKALAEAGVERIWTDRMSGARDERPELAALLDYARRGDVLMVWRLDRLGRSLPHLLTIAAPQALDQAGTPRAQIARTLGISRSSVYRCLDQRAIYVQSQWLIIRRSSRLLLD